MIQKKRSKGNGSTQGTISEEESPSSVGSQPLENEGHERFCLEVLNRKPNVRAYQLAYPDCSYDSARSNACRLIADDCIQARIAYLKEEQRNRLRMSADDVLMGLEMATRFDPAELLRPDGSMIPLHELPPEIRLCIEKVEYDEIYIGQGDKKKTIGRTAKVHTISKAKAYELLGKHHKLFTDRMVVTHKYSLEDILGGEVEEVEQ